MKGPKSDSYDSVVYYGISAWHCNNTSSVLSRHTRAVSLQLFSGIL